MTKYARKLLAAKYGKPKKTGKAARKQAREHLLASVAGYTPRFDGISKRQARSEKAFIRHLVNGEFVGGDREARGANWVKKKKHR